MKQFSFRRRGGLSLVELIMTLSILSILAALILPSARMMSKRTKEIELKRNLRILRNAIDDFKKTYDKAEDKKKTANKISFAPINKSGYPEKLDDLVEPHEFDSGDIAKESRRFLRKIPCDPFATDKTKACSETWRILSSTDKLDSSMTDGKDVFNVCSLSDETAIDGTKYSDCERW